MFNKAILIGNLTRDIELRYLPSGTAIGSTGIATNRKYKNQNGEQKEEVCFIDITFFGRTAEIANQYLKRGSKILVEGRLKYDQWTDQNGQKRSKHSIAVESLEMLGQRETTNTEQPARSYQQNTTTPAQNEPPVNKPKTPEIDIDDDEIPF